jgi:hypothetical protein
MKDLTMEQYLKALDEYQRWILIQERENAARKREQGEPVGSPA